MAENEVTDEIEYHVTFPSPASPTFSEEEDDFVRVPSASSKEAVVIMLGWAGCQDRHLKKYSAIYEQHGCITIRYTLPVDVVFVKGGRIQSIAIKILELLEDMELQENPVFFHIFSNGGCFLYRHVALLLSNHPQFIGIQLKGAVFDSCPGQRRISSAAKAMATSFQLPVILKYPVIFFVVCFMMLSHYLALFCNILGVGKPSEDFWESLMNDPTSCPQLFLYSKADEIVAFEDIETMIAHRKTLGIPVETICWDDSPHVAHFRVHREAYMSACYSFIDRNLE